MLASPECWCTPSWAAALVVGKPDQHLHPGAFLSWGKVERHFRADSSPGERSEGNSSAYDSIIKQASQRYQVPEGLIKAVIQVESNFNPQATSPAGAMGLMQLKPGTARDLGVRCAYNPGDNVGSAAPVS